ncbi:efflux RND transporter periplasmic adaptor subunit [Pseudomonas fluorescens]|uniref:efflux RND transporter periplasmic adaptor subunit n=1 Tax=Pseudomonas fluorescens TaxID=294 RepID=UPI0009364890|nr:HlyD family efflux transporter periplasmic adaptor subunit [Pseudomonas fluorescens]
MVLMTLTCVALIVKKRVIQPPPAPQWVSIQNQPLTQHIGLVGKFEPIQTIVLNAPFEGVIQSLEVEHGQWVQEGQTLLSMDPTLIELQLREALSGQLKAQRALQELKSWENGTQVARARRALRAADMSLSSLEGRLRESRHLFERGIIARNELDELDQQTTLQRLERISAQNELQALLSEGTGEARKIAEMELINATVKYEQLQQVLTRQTVVAPFTGVIVPVSASQGSGVVAPVQTGDRVSQNQSLLGLAHTQSLKVITTASELDINQLQPGQHVEILGDGFEGERLHGHIQTVGNLALPNDDPSASAQFPVTLALPELSPEQARRIRPGMSARLRIITYHNEQALIVAPEAISQEGNEMTVAYRKDEDQPIERRVVTVGHANAEGVEVFGLAPGLVRLGTQ